MSSIEYSSYSAVRSLLERYYRTLVRLDVSALAVEAKDWQPGLPSPEVVQRLQVKAAEVGRLLRELGQAERLVVELEIAHPHRPIYAPKIGGKKRNRRSYAVDKITVLNTVARAAGGCLMCGGAVLRWNAKRDSRSCRRCGFSDRWHRNKYHRVLDDALDRFEVLARRKGLL